MNRRSLLLLSLLALPGRLFGQDSPRRTPRSRQVSDEDTGPPVTTRKRRSTTLDDEPAAGDLGPSEGTPANFPNQAGFVWKNLSIAKYTALDAAATSPQTAIIDWIFRRTTPAPWHGDKIAVLCASRTQLRAYNSPKYLQYVAETVERFTDAQADILKVRVRFIAAADAGGGMRSTRG
jgi:hypothetical protein